MKASTQLLTEEKMISTGEFSLPHTFGSGQPLTFHADYSESNGNEQLTYATGKGVISIMKNGSRIRYSYSNSYNNAGARKEIIRRFGLSDDLDSIYRDINTDSFMETAIKDLKGMRITENDPWETTLCFILSQFNNIKRIRLITKNLIARFGEVHEFEGRSFRLFPSASSIASVSIPELMSCGTGFRAKYIKSAAADCSTGLDLDRLYGMDYADAKAALMELDGVGDKVADCILVFGYKKLDAFPIDTWMKRVVEEVYFKGRRKSIKQIHGFAERRWGPMQGYAQQYIFHYGRINKVGK